MFPSPPHTHITTIHVFGNFFKISFLQKLIHSFFVPFPFRRTSSTHTSCPETALPGKELPVLSTRRLGIIRTPPTVASLVATNIILSTLAMASLAARLTPVVSLVPSPPPPPLNVTEGATELPKLETSFHYLFFLGVQLNPHHS